MTVTWEEYSQAFLLSIAKPVSDNNLKSCICWIASENSKADNNPFDTTEPYANATIFNSAGVKNYATLDDGVNATKATILNGRYGAILDCFDKSAAPAETCSQITNSVWGSKPTPELVATVLANYDHYSNLPVAGTSNESEITVSDTSPSGEVTSGANMQPVGDETGKTGDALALTPDNKEIKDAGGTVENAPFVAGFDSKTGDGYTLIMADGGVITKGDAVFHGSLVQAGHELNAPIVAAWPTPDGNGYKMLGQDGGIFTFGNGEFVGVG